MYKVFRLKVGENIIHPAFLFRILKSPAFIQKYRNLGKGSVKRRKSIAFEKFAAISVPIPSRDVQLKVVEQIEVVQDLERQLSAAQAELIGIVERTLKLVGLA